MSLPLPIPNPQFDPSRTLGHAYGMITSLQIRAARALKRWSVAQAARECETSHKTMLRAEMGEGVPNLRAATLEKIQRGFEAAGIEFIAENRHGTGGVGVRLRRQP